VVPLCHIKLCTTPCTAGPRAAPAVQSRLPPPSRTVFAPLSISSRAQPPTGPLALPAPSTYGCSPGPPCAAHRKMCRAAFRKDLVRCTVVQQLSRLALYLSSFSSSFPASVQAAPSLSLPCPSYSLLSPPPPPFISIPSPVPLLLSSNVSPPPFCNGSILAVISPLMLLHVCSSKHAINQFFADIIVSKVHHGVALSQGFQNVYTCIRV
jgi:hypothetical protein